MPKNILIFSDGTGQAGGLLPDERRSNVYKLFRATRCGPDSRIDPAEQLAFYDAGLGSASDADDVKISFLRKIYNVVSQATGFGITKNIIDCYTAILQTWEPGDRIFLFGFSRGAYTARCVGGVLGRCGVPTKGADGGKLKRDSVNARRIATEAVKDVYQHGSGRRDKKFRRQRQELATRFRIKYGSQDDAGEANAVPYFIGVWDTVGALGINRLQQFIMLGTGALLVTGLAALSWTIIPWEFNIRSWIALCLSIIGLGFAIWYVVSHVRIATGLSDPWWTTLHMTAWRMRFYDTLLDPRVQFAKHALSIDENRVSFERVPWTNDKLDFEGRDPSWFEQIWFAGVHSDVGGSYPETESRLSDISLEWMVDRATRIPHPVIVERRWLNLFPSPRGMQHDEVKSNRMPWKTAIRPVPSEAPLHPSVLARFEAGEVLQYDETIRYRPEALRQHHLASKYYD